ncbi:MAG: zf-HC2 domain-containing protein [Acidobacteria bacterium]|nr:zf-HC2 domain-containing protein [Acidobacteriota bacterium]
MACRVYSDNLTAFLDGELSRDEKVQLQKHLEDCSACSEEYQSLAVSCELIEQLRELEPSAQLWHRIAQATAAKPGARFAINRRAFKWMRWAAPITAAAGLFWGTFSILDERNIENKFNTFLKERNQAELSHSQFANPFTDHKHEWHKNPFSSK